MDEMTKRTQDAIRARDTLIFIETVEEAEAIKNVQHVGLAMNQSVVAWNPVENFLDITLEGGVKAMPPMDKIENLQSMLTEIREHSGDAIFILQDINFFLDQDRTDLQELASLIRNFKLLKHELRLTKKTILFFGTQYNLPQELRDDFTLIRHSRPDKKQIQKILIDFIASQHWEDRLTDDEKVRDIIIDASKDLHEQPWFKSDLFCERHKDIIGHAWEEYGPQLEGIREINEH